MPKKRGGAAVGQKFVNPMSAAASSADADDSDDDEAPTVIGSTRSLVLGVPALQALQPDEVDRIIKLVEVVTFDDGDIIVEEGADGVDMFIIQTGKAVCTKIGVNDGNPIKLYSPGDFFGERAMLVKEARAASIHADGKVRALALTN